jgi:hypothetical protein
MVGFRSVQFGIGLAKTETDTEIPVSVIVFIETGQFGSVSVSVITEKWSKVVKI